MAIPKTDPTKSSDVNDNVPKSLRIAGAFSWRFLVIAAAIAVIMYLVIQLSIVVIPFLIAVLISALLVPVVSWLLRHGWPKWLAIIVSILGVLVIIAGLLTFAVRDVVNTYPDLRARSIDSFTNLQEFLLSSFGITNTDIHGYSVKLFDAIQNNSQVITSGLKSVGETAGHAVAGLLLGFFTLLFILIDGKNIWKWVVHLFPKNARKPLDGAGKAGWFTLTSFVKTQVVVALVDALGIGIGASILHVPLAIPIAVIVFLGSFIPVIGAVITGFIAVFMALIFNGPVAALIMVGVVILVQEIESHVLQPFLIGKAVKIHPLAIVFAVAIGSLIAGIPGALFAVPLVAVINRMTVYIARKEWLIKKAF